MKKSIAKVLSIVLVLIMVVSAMPVSAMSGISDGSGRDIRDWWRDLWKWWVRPTPIEVIDYPAQQLEAELAGGVTVTVEAPKGALPAKTRMSAVSIDKLSAVQAAVDSAEDVSGTVLTAVDITFYNGNSEVQPRKDVQVTITSDALSGMDNLSVVHLDVSAENLGPNSDAEPVDDVETGDESVVFNARHFSVYAVVDEGVEDSKARLEVRFFGEDTVNPIATVLINPDQNSDEIIAKIIDIEPEVVTNSLTVNDLVFCGWMPYRRNYDVDDIDGEHDIDYVRSAVKRRLQRPVSEGDVMNVYAMLFYEFSVKFVGEPDSITEKSPVIEAITLYSKDGSPVNYDIDLSYTPSSLATSKFNGWIVSGDTSGRHYAYHETVSVAGDILFMPDISNGHWISFNEKPTDEYKGAKYVAPVFFEDSQSMNGYVPANSELAGYTFGGWYTDTTYTTQFSFTGTLTENKTLYAKWTMAARADYTIIVWQQDVYDTKEQNLEISEKNYNYLFSTTVNSASTSTNIGNTLINAYTGFAGNQNVQVDGNTYNFLGFKYAGFNYLNDRAGRIHPAGTTVINVYYDRELVTIRFNVQDTDAALQRIDLSSKPTLYWGNPVYFVYDSSYGYCPIRYYDSTYSNVYVPTTNSYSTTNTQYAVIDGVWYELDWDRASGSSTYFWWYKSVVDNEWHVWTGTRYRYYDYIDTSSLYYYTYPYVLDDTLTGLYGSTLEYNNYTWPLDQWWYNKSVFQTTDTRTRTTFLDAFIPASTSMTVDFYGQIMTESNHIYFYKQNSDGTGYELANTMGVAHGSSGSSTFYLSDKYNGFTIHEYSTTGADSGFVTVGTQYTSSNGDLYYHTHNDEAESLSYSGDAYVRFDRHRYNIEYMWGSFLDGNGNYLTPLRTGLIKSEKDIYFEASIDSYKVGGSNYFDPTRTLGDSTYVFEGWYKDPECTKPFDFTGMNMPANDIAVFARFRTVQYRVFLRNVGEESGANYTVTYNDSEQSQNFRVDAGKLVSNGQIIEATRSDGKILAGWYTDAAFENAFDFAEPLTDDNTLEYDKTLAENMTDNVGTASASNSDVNRSWITRKLDLYAKWVEPLANVDGINVVYDSNQSETITGTRQGDETHVGQRYYTDPALYSDGVTAIVRSASTPDNSEYAFDHWELLDKNGNVIGTYKPGEKFNINAALMARDVNPAAGGSKGVDVSRDTSSTDNTRSNSTPVQPVAVQVNDTLTRDTTGITGTTYTSWSGKTANSSAVYAGNSAGGNSSIQLRTTNSNSGIVSTTSGGKIRKVTVVWNSNTSSGRTLDVYGSNTAYTGATQLYATSTQGTKLGSIVYGTSTELTITGDYDYVGVRSNSGALYLTSITFTWETDSGSTEETRYVLTNTIEAGKTYLIVYGNQNNAASSTTMRVMNSYGDSSNTGYQQMGTPTFADGTHAVITAVSVDTGTIADCEWTAGTGSAAGTYTFVNDGYYLVETSADDGNLSASQSTNYANYRDWNVVKHNSYDFFNIHNYYWHTQNTARWYFLYYTTTGFTNYYNYASSYTPGNVEDSYRMYLYEKVEGTTSYTVDAQVNNSSFGSVTPASSTVSANGTLTLTAAPNDGYRIVSVTVYPVSAATVTVTGNEIAVTGVSDNCTVTVNFEAVPAYTVTFKNGSNVISTQTVYEGAAPTAPADPSAPTGKRFDGWTIEGGDDTVYSSANLPAITGDTAFVAHFSNAPIAGWYFEYAYESEVDWTFVDADGDGYNWTWQGYNVNQTTSPEFAYEGIGNLTSASYYSSTGALTPNNWAFSPAVTLPTGYASVTLYAKGQDASYAAEHIAIYAGTSADPASMVMVSSEIVTTGEYLQYSADLNDFLGQTVYIGIRHYNVTDMFRVNVDQVEIWGEDAEVEPQGPFTVTFIDSISGETISTQTVENGGDAVAPTIPVHEGYTFAGWSIGFTGVTSDLTVYAMYRDNSAVVDLNTSTVLLRAVYKNKVKTFITWHANNGTGNVVNSENVLINENINIQFPQKDTGNWAGTTTAITRWGDLVWTDHEFLGWARVEIGDTEHGVGAEFDPNDPAYVKQRSFTEDDLFLKYVAPAEGQTHGTFQAKIKDVWTDVKYVAADELDPYHAMYAVWADVFYVYHSGDNSVERIVRTTKAGTYDLTANLAPNTLYGGYYTSYSLESDSFDIKSLGWASVTADDLTDGIKRQTGKEDAGGTAYNGVNYQWSGAQTANGTAITPVAGTTYYIKEVPADKYLQPYLHYTYNLGTGAILGAWVISDIDDLRYNETGFIVITERKTAKIAKSLTINTTNGGVSVTLTAPGLFGVGDSTTKNRLTYLDVRGGENGNLLQEGATVVQYWITPDNVLVTGTNRCTYTGVDNVDTIAVSVEAVASTITDLN